MSEEGENAFGQLLTELREARGWTKTQLAERAGLDPSSVSRLEAGFRAPEPRTVEVLVNGSASVVARLAKCTTGKAQPRADALDGGVLGDRAVVSPGCDPGCTLAGCGCFIHGGEWRRILDGRCPEEPRPHSNPLADCGAHRCRSSAHPSSRHDADEKRRDA